MRVSADIDDPDFSLAAVWLQVYLDGQQLGACITADSDRGEVLCYELDERGRIRFDPDTKRAIVAHRTGKVEIYVDQRVSCDCDRVLTAEQLVERYRVAE